MSATDLTICCDSYKNNIFSGLSRLQGKQEFVDLTLAADGHLVKVHKNVIALASPYLKEMMQSLSSENPVIFLNNVSHNILTFLLEYIYQGEVRIPNTSLESFLQIAKSLRIVGINQFVKMPKETTVENNIQPQVQTNLIEIPTNIIEQQTETIPMEPQTSIGPSINTFQSQVQSNMIETPSTSTFQQPIESNVCESEASAVSGLVEPKMQSVIGLDSHNESTNNFAACITINSDRKLEVQHFAENPPVPTVDQSFKKPAYITTISESMPDIENMPIVISNNMDVDMSANDSQQATSNAATEKPPLNMGLKIDQESKDALKKITQFSITERGALQIIVSRYMYCSHHSSKGGRKHRWRCLDYRRLKCPAYIDTFDNAIVLRYGLHNHEFHDEKIYEKHHGRKIFSSLQQAEAFRDNGQISVKVAYGDVENEIETNVIYYDERK